MESGSGTSPQASNSETSVFQSSKLETEIGSIMLATNPIQANLTARKPAGASESLSISAIAAGLQALSPPATVAAPRPRRGRRLH